MNVTLPEHAVPFYLREVHTTNRHWVCATPVVEGVYNRLFQGIWVTTPKVFVYR